MLTLELKAVYGCRGSFNPDETGGGGHLTLMKQDVLGHLTLMKQEVGVI
jgi:hypothetical protein